MPFRVTSHVDETVNKNQTDSLVDIGMLFRRSRLDNGWTCRQAAKELGISATQVCHFELGTERPTWRILQRASVVFGYDLDQLLKLSNRWGQDFEEQIERKPELLEVYMEIKRWERSALKTLLANLERCKIESEVSTDAR